MLTEGQKNYLNNLSNERSEGLITITPYNPKTDLIAEKVVKQIKEILPESDIRYMGASALKISGQNDVDIYIISTNDLKETYLSKLSVKFGNQIKRKWQWFDDGIEVSVYVSDPSDAKFQEQLRIFDILKHTPEILKKYEVLKESMNNRSYKEYQIAKYEFYNKVLGLEFGSNFVQ